MAIQIVHRYPATRRGRRLLRSLAVALGALLLFLGMVVGALDLLLVAALTRPRSSPRADPYLLAYLGGLTAAALIGLWLGIRLLRGRRRLGLLLRRFGFRETTRTMSFVAAAGVGRRWRMAAVDDADIAPVGTVRGRRPGVVLASLLGLAAAGYLAYWVFTGGVERFADRVLEQDGLAPDLDAALGELLDGAVPTALAAAVVLLLATAGLVIGTAGGLRSRAVNAAQERATIVIGRGEDLRRSLFAFRRNKRRVLGSRLTVCRIASPLWPDAVTELAAISDAVIIDVSRATENLVWELASLLAAPAGRLVLVCHHDRVADLDSVPSGTEMTPQVELAELLDGREVLVYGAGPREQRRLARSLRNRLDTLADAALGGSTLGDSTLGDSTLGHSTSGDHEAAAAQRRRSWPQGHDRREVAGGAR